jgi:hypothetical protein
VTELCHRAPQDAQRARAELLVERIVKIWGYVNVAPGFTDMPSVINGESDVLVKLWGERGRHAVASAPRAASV